MTFTSRDGSGPMKKYRLDTFLTGDVHFPKATLALPKIMEEANKKGIIPVRIVLMNHLQRVVKTVTLNSSNSEKEWIVPSFIHSYIVYKHEFTMPTTFPTIRIHHFFNFGFPKPTGIVDSKYLQHLASSQHDVTITIKKLLLLTKEDTLEEEIIFKSDSGEIIIPNKNQCKLIYTINCGFSNLEVRLDHLLERKTFPKDPIKTLTLEKLEQCVGFQDVVLRAFQSDLGTNKPLPLDHDNFINYEYSNRNISFLYYFTAFEPELSSVRLDHLLDRGYFPHVDVEASQLNESDNDSLNESGSGGKAPSRDALEDPELLAKLKAGHDFLWSFVPKMCKICKNKWFVTDKANPGNVDLDILNPKKTKFCFRMTKFYGDVCDRCEKDTPAAGLPKMFSAENNMDFGPTFPEIDALNPFEEMLLARVSTLVSVVTLTSTGYLSYQGHSVNFHQKTTEWFNKLPRKASDLKFLLIVRKGAPDAQKRKAFKVRREVIVAAMTKLREVNPHYAPDKVIIDWKYVKTLPDDDIPADANVIEKEMHHYILITEELLQKWLTMTKPLGSKLIQHLDNNKVTKSQYFPYITKEITMGETDTSISSEKLVQYFESHGFLQKQENGDNHELLVAELTHAAMDLDDGENAIPTPFLNIEHEEQEGQKTACNREFDNISGAVFGTPSIDALVVVKEGAFKYNLGKVVAHNEDGSLTVHFDKAFYSGGYSTNPEVGQEVQINSSQFGSLTGTTSDIHGLLMPVFKDVLLPFNASSLHLQSHRGKEPQECDLVTILSGSRKGDQACLKSRIDDECRVVLMDGIILHTKIVDLKLVSEKTEVEQSQNPPLSTPGFNVQKPGRIPMPVFEGPEREDTPINERESNILPFAFPKLFQTGTGDVNAPRLRDLNEGKQDGLHAYISHCLYWHDNRFAKHPRMMYVLYNKWLRLKLIKTKSYYLKSKNPTIQDFLPENRKKTEKVMMAYTAALPTTPGFKKQRRNELESMAEQIKYMTANRQRVERVMVENEYEDVSSSEDEDEIKRPSFWEPTQDAIPEEAAPAENNSPEIQDSNEEDSSPKKIKKRPIEGRIPCYWATLTTAPFRSSLFPYYITGNHDTEDDVKVRRKLAIENPNIVAFFSALQLELVLKYVMQDMLDLDDYYCVYEWGSGGVLHLHCILWNMDSEFLEEYDLVKHAASMQKESAKRKFKNKMQKIANFFNVHVSEWHLGKHEDGSWKNLPKEDDSAHPASISKSKLDQLLKMESEYPEDSDAHQMDQINKKQDRIAYMVKLHEAVQQHNIHKPHSLGPPLPNQKCAKEGKDPLQKKKIYCSKGYPKTLRSYGLEDIEQDPLRHDLLKLCLERNDKTINNHNPILSYAVLANMDLQAIMTEGALYQYVTKYVTKNDNPDIFRDYRDEGGRPNDPNSTSAQRSEIPIQPKTVYQEAAKMLNNQVKYSMLSQPELYHHLLGLPTHHVSRTFLKIGLLSNSCRLLPAEEIQKANPEAEKQPEVVRKSEVGTYEEREAYEIPLMHQQGELELNSEKLKQMSLFLFHKQFFVRNNKLCRKSKPPIILIKPYFSPRMKKNPNFDLYMRQTLLAYKPFCKKEEITNLAAEELKAEYLKFTSSEICPSFVNKAFEKANEKKKKKKQTQNGSQDEVENEALANSDSDGDSDNDGPDYVPMPNPEKESNLPQDPTAAQPPIAKFTEAYQEYGHMAPKGLDYEGTDIAAFDDDNDVVEEIRILSREEHLIWNHTKDPWHPLFPELLQEAKKAETILREKVGVAECTTLLDPAQLDPTQKLFLSAIIDWENQCIEMKKAVKPFPPLKIKLLGVAGTGKSRTIKTLLQEWNRVMKESDLNAEKKGKIVMAAPTGVAAFNIGCGAASVHRTFNIPVRGKFQDLTGDAQKSLESAFENVWLIIIDEISMVGCEMFAKVDARLTQAKLDDNHTIATAQKDNSLRRPSFGGLGMIICGDFAQLVPIMQHSLMDSTMLPLQDAPKEKDRFTNKGKELKDEFRASYMLDKQHRQSGGAYASLCLKFRDGSFSPEDHKVLQKRNYDDLPLEEQLCLEEKGTRLVTTNKHAGNYNAKKLVMTAQKFNQKIFRFNAYETGNKSKATTTSENFSGLKSTVHLTIGSRVMLNSNIWIEAGLINGAQGNLRDIVFCEGRKDEEPWPMYALVELDDYKGPALFEDESKRNWVPIFTVIRRHQFNANIEREQLPLRLSAAMTGHKVQGLSLYEGVVVHYPRPDECKKNPLDTWGLNYCILTRVPSLDKISFIQLPSYEKHMRLYTKTKGKNFFKMFLKFDKRCRAEFEQFVNIAAKISTKELSSLKQMPPVTTPINFPLIFCNKETNNQSADSSQPLPKPNSHARPQPQPEPKPQQPKQPETKPKRQQRPPQQRPEAQPVPQFAPQLDNPPRKNNSWFKSVLKAFKHATKQSETKPKKQQGLPQQRPQAQPVPQFEILSQLAPQFDNPLGKNNCWFNSVLQVIIHAIKIKGEYNQFFEANTQIVNQEAGILIYDQIRKYQQLGRYSVNSNIFDEVTLKMVMILTMEDVTPGSLHAQYDAADCMSTLLRIISNLSFLWHLQRTIWKCESCNRSISDSDHVAMARVAVSNHQCNNIIDAAGAIKNYFESAERGVEKNCDDCHGQRSTKSTMLPTPSKFIVVQLLRFMATEGVGEKISTEAIPFSSVDIETCQGMCTYEVVGTVQHIGDRLEAGHFKAFIKQDNNWLECNDERITSLGINANDPTKNAYLVILRTTELDTSSPYS